MLLFSFFLKLASSLLSITRDGIQLERAIPKGPPPKMEKKGSSDMDDLKSLSCPLPIGLLGWEGTLKEESGFGKGLRGLPRPQHSMLTCFLTHLG